MCSFAYRCVHPSFKFYTAGPAGRPGTLLQSRAQARQRGCQTSRRGDGGILCLKEEFMQERRYEHKQGTQFCAATCFLSASVGDLMSPSVSDLACRRQECPQEIPGGHARTASPQWRTICSSGSSHERAFVSCCLGAMSRTNKDIDQSLSPKVTFFSKMCVSFVVFAPRVFVSKTF